MNWIADIIIGVLAMVGTLGGAYFANKKSTALIAYRLEQKEEICGQSKTTSTFP